MSPLQSLPPLRPITEENPYKIVFVCLGNICRSPTGEGVMQHLINENGFQNYFEIDSAGTSAWHEGEPANSKSRSVAESHGVKLLSRARQFEKRDFEHFDLIIAMDLENKKNLLALAGTEDHKEKVQLLRNYDDTPEDGQVPDPYYGGLSGFENVFQIVQRSCKALFEKLKPQISP